MVSAILVTFVILTLLVLVNTLPRGILISNIMLLVLFLFAVPNIDPNLGAFYSIMILGVLILTPFVNMKDGSKFSLLKIKGLNIPIVEILFAGVLFGLMYFASFKAPGNIIGVPQSLAISGTTLNNFMPALIAGLGFIENRFFLALKLFLDQTIKPVVQSVIPIPAIAGLIITGGVSLLFAVFHLTAYAGSIAGMTFAFLIMGMWLVSYDLIGELPGSISHFGWNAFVSLSRTLKII